MYGDLDEAAGDHAEWEKAVLKDYIPRESIYRKLLKWPNSKEEQIRGCKGQGQGRAGVGEQEEKSGYGFKGQQGMEGMEPYPCHAIT